MDISRTIRHGQRLIGALALMALPAAAQQQAEARLSPFTENVVLHVLMHEMGHAILREFDIPVLGPEEGIAEDFATVYLHLTMPDRAGEIVRDRAAQHRMDGEDPEPFSEYPGDAQMAGRNICLLYGMDPERHAELARDAGLEGEAADICADLGPEVLRSWRRVLAPLWLPPGNRVTEVGAEFDESSVEARALHDSDLAGTVYDLASRIDWHSRITFSFAQCDGGAGWFRNGRQIRLCDAYVRRFEEQSARK